MGSSAAELTRLRAELARLEEERDSLARVATGALHALQHTARQPVGFWIKQEEEKMAEHLLEADEVRRMNPDVGTWARMVVSSPHPFTDQPYATDAASDRKSVV